MKHATKDELAVVASTVLLAIMYGCFIYFHFQQFVESRRLSLVLLVLFETLCLIFIVTRKDPNATWHSWQTYLATMGGIFSVLLFRPTGAPADLFAGQLIQMAGFVLQILALASLNRSFGLLPAHRGVKSSGLYRWVRHPLYFAYMISCVGYVVNNFSLYNMAVIGANFGLQVLRILHEEAFLSRYAEYAKYARRTRWRLIPLMW